MIWLAREGIFVGAERMSEVQTASVSHTGTLQSWMLQVIDRLMFFRAHKVKFSLRSMATPSTLHVPRHCTHDSDKVWCGKLYPSDPAQSPSLLHDKKDLCSQQMKNNISIDALKAHIMAAAWNSDITKSNHHLHLRRGYRYLLQYSSLSDRRISASLGEEEVGVHRWL